MAMTLKVAKQSIALAAQTLTIVGGAVPMRARRPVAVVPGIWRQPAASVGTAPGHEPPHAVSACPIARANPPRLKKNGSERCPANTRNFPDALTRPLLPLRSPLT